MNTKQIFVQQLENFIEEICGLFPDIKSLQVFKQQYELMKMVNSKVLIENFIYYVLPHKEEIMSENEEFFKSGGGQDFLEGQKDLIKFRDTMSDIWIQKLSDANKAICWKYFKVFVLLSERYLREMQELNG